MRNFRDEKISPRDERKLATEFHGLLTSLQYVLMGSINIYLLLDMVVIIARAVFIREWSGTNGNDFHALGVIGLNATRIITAAKFPYD